MEPKLGDSQARGTRILIGKSAANRRAALNHLISVCEKNGFEEIFLPSIEPAQIYVDKAGPEVLNQMYTFEDRKGRKLCLRPEGTATCQVLANKTLRRAGETKLWYESRCWRYEKPQAGRYREFTQFGVEVLNPNKYTYEDLMDFAETVMQEVVPGCVVTRSVKRGLAYYTDAGFEVSCPWLGAQQQVLGGGKYAEGFGFAIGLDRLVLAIETDGKDE